MEKAVTSSLDKVGRRLSAVKVVVDLLNHELDLSKADRGVNLERERLEAAVSTLELFIEDIEALQRASSRGEDKVLETSRLEPSRPAASRVT